MGKRTEAPRSAPRGVVSCLLAGGRRLSWLLVQAALLLISLYQRFISPCLRPRCRFVPSCSSYAQQCLKQYGLLRGSAKTVWRLLRCHPLCKGGLDQP